MPIRDLPFPVVLVDGEPRERGRQHGNLAGSQITIGLERYMERFAHYQNLSPTEVRRRAAGYAEAIREYDPDLLEEIEGIAEGADVDRDEVLALNCRSEVMFGTAPPLECTSFGLQPSATANGHTYVGQNWDWSPNIKETLILLVIKQEPRPTVVLLDEAGMIGRMGMNSAGMALSTNTLISEQSQIGVPYNMLLRGVLNQENMAAAIAALVKPRRALSANYLIGDGHGQTLDIEVSPVHIDYVPPRDGIITHGNHFAGTRLTGRDLSLERFPDSLYRESRLRESLAAHTSGITERHIKDALQDSYGSPNAIARRADPKQQPLDQLETVASIIMDATDQHILLAKGPIDETTQYRKFVLDDLTSGRVPMASATSAVSGEVGEG